MKNSHTRKEYAGIFGLSEMIKYLIISIAEGEVVQVSGINQILKKKSWKKASPKLRKDKPIHRISNRQDRNKTK